MTSFKTSSVLSLMAIVLTLTFSSSAMAESTFTSAFPGVSILCQEAKSGTLPGNLETQAPQVLEACTTAETAFTGAQTELQKTLLTLQKEDLKAKMTYEKTVQAATKTKFQAILLASKEHNHLGVSSARKAFKAARLQAHRTFLETHETIKLAKLEARQTYQLAIQNVRFEFQDTVAALRHD